MGPADVPVGNPFARVWDDVTGLVGIAGPGTDYVKRVIGVPGDHVVCCNAPGQITVNGVALSEKSYIYPEAAPSQIRFNITVPPGRLWVMGDNRADSDDSRYRLGDPGGGTIPESAVVGRAFVIICPLSRIGDLPIPNTFQQAGLRAAAAVGDRAARRRRRRRRRPVRRRARLASPSAELSPRRDGRGLRLESIRRQLGRA